MAEAFKQRLKRYVDQPATDTLGWMTMMLQNEHAAELGRAREYKLYHCVYLLAHSIVQTVSETMFGLTGLDGTHFFLQSFADGTTGGFEVLDDIFGNPRCTQYHCPPRLLENAARGAVLR
jgi:hypothetical protein